MFGKAIIATILGAGVTGGAVYLAANPELLDTKSHQSAPVEADKERAETPAVTPQNAPDTDHDHDHADGAAHDHDDTDMIADSDIPEEGTPIEVVLIDSDSDSDSDAYPGSDEGEPPVLPEARQLTTRTVIDVDTGDSDESIEPARPDAEAAPEAAAISATDEEAAQARRMANADFSRIMKQAERMGSVDLRDQAYLSAVEFALSNDNYAGAVTAMDSLSQPQLRDTARSKIAVKFAQNGKVDAAFRVIDQVEIDDLRDFMRLQVIEAITRKQ